MAAANRNTAYAILGTGVLLLYLSLQYRQDAASRLDVAYSVRLDPRNDERLTGYTGCDYRTAHPGMSHPLDLSDDLSNRWPNPPMDTLVC